jgi:hypothetical protein
VIEDGGVGDVWAVCTAVHMHNRDDVLDHEAGVLGMAVAEVEKVCTTRIEGMGMVAA